jgi:outer membrane protein assembly factor BamB
MQTKMTNVVVCDGYIYGLSGGILECIRASDLERMWKKGRYGHGQIMRVGEVLLVLSEQGDVLLIEATPDRHRLLAEMHVFDDVTWNNPAFSSPYLLVRNHREAVCYELPLATAP